MTEMQAAAWAEATRNGFKAGANNSVTVVPSVATPAGSAVAVVDVEVRREVPLFMLAIFKEDEQIIAAGAGSNAVRPLESSRVRRSSIVGPAGVGSPSPKNAVAEPRYSGSRSIWPCSLPSDPIAAGRSDWSHARSRKPGSLRSRST